MIAKIIRNRWEHTADGHRRAAILSRHVHPEGLDISRFALGKDDALQLDSSEGHILTVLDGRLAMAGASGKHNLQLGSCVHAFIPVGWAARLNALSAAHIIVISAPASQVRGKRLIIRDEHFIRACADTATSFRWILTPQYLSRRVFLYHDPTLLSKTGKPVAWFRTTMFDVTGLPGNCDDLPVFKMSYDNQTEANVCYDVRADARVRFARHPYVNQKQQWDDWQTIDNNTTYHLNEAPHDAEVEWHCDSKTGLPLCRRNRHEIHIAPGGHVSLCCLFDPAPVGVERHLPGEYSSYEDVEKFTGTPAYEKRLRDMQPYDEMIDALSLGRANPELNDTKQSKLLLHFKTGLHNQLAHESQLIATLRESGNNRHAVVERWRTTAAV